MNWADRKDRQLLVFCLWDISLCRVSYCAIQSMARIKLTIAVPSNLFLNKIGLPAVYLPSCMIVWGIISGATAGCHNFGGLLATRFFLGFVEAAYFVSI